MLTLKRKKEWCHVGDNHLIYRRQSWHLTYYAGLFRCPRKQEVKAIAYFWLTNLYYCKKFANIDWKAHVQFVWAFICIPMHFKFVAVMAFRSRPFLALKANHAQNQVIGLDRIGLGTVQEVLKLCYNYKIQGSKVCNCTAYASPRNGNNRVSLLHKKLVITHTTMKLQ